MFERETFILTRDLPRPPASVWAMWTTASGIEAWWGPPGFAVTVESLDLRVGGRLAYTMRAVAPEMVAFMKANGMPVATPCTLTYTEVAPTHRLAWVNLVDFVTGHEPYRAGNLLELTPTPTGTHLRLTVEAMHDADWTGRAVEGWRLEIGKLEAVFARGDGG